MKRIAWWALFVILSLVAAFCALTFVVTVVEAISGNVGKGESRGGDIGAAVFLLIVTGILAFVARSVEHHARVHHGREPLVATPGGSPPVPAGGGSYEGPVRDDVGLMTPPPPSLPHVGVPGVGVPAVAGSFSAPATGTPASRPKAVRKAPHSAAGGLFTLCLMVVIFAVVSVVGFVDWHQSESVQDHGIAATGVITTVDNINHSTRSGSYTTVNLDVRLATPIDGRLATTVHTPDSSVNVGVGDTVSILVDRSDAGYAELPGQPANSITEAIVGLVFLLLIVGPVLFLALRPSKKKHRHT